jgi:hypothetical protein
VVDENAEPRMVPFESIAYASEVVNVFGRYCWRSTTLFALPFQSSAWSALEALTCP